MDPRGIHRPDTSDTRAAGRAHYAEGPQSHSLDRRQACSLAFDPFGLLMLGLNPGGIRAGDSSSFAGSRSPCRELHAVGFGFHRGPFDDHVTGRAFGVFVSSAAIIFLRILTGTCSKWVVGLRVPWFGFFIHPHYRMAGSTGQLLWTEKSATFTCFANVLM